VNSCPRCGSAVSPFALSCPTCGLPRPDVQPTTPAQQFRPEVTAPPGRRTATILIATGAVVLLLAVAALGALWVARAWPFGSQESTGAGQSRPATVPLSSSTASDSSTAIPGSPTTAPAGTQKDFSQVYAAVESGVGLISVDTCDAAYTGTGFLVRPDTVVTAAHVVEGATDVQVDFDGTQLDAMVAGVDNSLDLAVLTVAPSSAERHVFELAADDPDTGTDIAVIGYPLGEPKSLTKGTISGLERTITTESGTFTGLLQTDAAINPGNSGGPLLNDSGEIVGVADAIRQDAQGIGFAVPISKVRGAIESGTGLGLPVEPHCGRPQGNATTSGVRRALRAYFGAVNSGDYDKAMSLLSDSMRAGSPRSQWYSDYRTTYDDQLTLLSVEGTPTAVQVWAGFRSRQDPGYGPAGAKNATCLLWSIDYGMVKKGDGWVIDAVSAHMNPPWVHCD